MPHVKNLGSGDIGDIQRFPEVTPAKINEIEQALAKKKKVTLTQPAHDDKKPHFIVIHIGEVEVLRVRKY